IKRAAPPGHGKKTEFDGEQENQHWAQGKIWECKSKKCEDADSSIRRPASAVRRKHARGNSDRGTNDQRQEGKLKRCGIAFENDSTHGRLEFERLPEIAARELPEIVAILRMEGHVEAEQMAQLCYLSWSSALA